MQSARSISVMLICVLCDLRVITPCCRRQYSRTLTSKSSSSSLDASCSNKTEGGSTSVTIVCVCTMHQTTYLNESGRAYFKNQKTKHTETGKYTTLTFCLLIVRSARAFSGEGNCQLMLAHVWLLMALFKIRIIVCSILSSAFKSSNSL